MANLKSITRLSASKDDEEARRGGGGNSIDDGDERNKSQNKYSEHVKRAEMKLN